MKAANRFHKALRLYKALLLLVSAIGLLYAQYEAFPHKQNITLNTSASGASIGSAVTNFPVLVRLTSANFDFTKAQNNGADIRFSQGATTLAYEIESWDATGRQAAIWVKVPTIAANNATQLITLHCQNPTAVSASNGAAVFELSNGFVGVWHLNESGTASRANATGAGFNGTATTTGVAGLIGGADNFSNSYINLGDIDLVSTFTLSAWVNPTSFQDWDRIIVKHHPFNVPPYTVYSMNLSNDNSIGGERLSTAVKVPSSADRYFGNFDPLVEQPRVALNAWTYAAGTYNNSQVISYINAQPGTLIGSVTGNLDQNNENTYIGHNPIYGGQNFAGKMDEVRIENVARSADWIKLCYENQRAVQKLVTVIPPPSAPSILAQPQPATVPVGGTATFTVSASGSPVPNYKWQRNGVDLSVSGRVSGVASATLQITGVTFADSGNYRVIITNTQGTVTSANAKLTVVQSPGPPQIVTSPADTSVQLGSSHTFRVTAQGYPAITTYNWYKVGDQYSKSNYDSLKIPGVSISDTGRYYVTVANAEGSVSSDTARLIAVCNGPTITAQPLSDTIVADSTARFSVSATGTQLSYVWQRDTGDAVFRAITGAGTALYTSFALKSNDGYRFRVIVTNGCGGQVTSNVARLTVRDIVPPTVSPGLSLTLVPAVTTIQVRWTTPESPSTDVKQVVITYSSTAYPTFGQASADTAALTLPTRTGTAGRDTLLGGLSAQTKYYFSLFLLDSAGNTIRGDTASVVTRAPNTPFNPLTVTGSRIDSARVRVEIRGFAGVPTWDYAQSPPGLFVDTTYADTVGIWWNSGSFPVAPLPGATDMARLLLFDMQKGAEPYIDTLPVTPLDMETDSVYFLNVSLFWHSPDSIIAFDTTNGSRVDMVDRRAPTNPLVVTGEYNDVGGNDSATLFIDSLGLVDAGFVDRIIIRFTEDENGLLLISQDTLLLADVLAAAVDGRFGHGVVDARFDGARDTVYSQVKLLSRSNVASVGQSTFIVVGHVRPDNPVILGATALGPTRIVLSWNHLPSSIERIRVLWSTSALPTGRELTEDDYSGVLETFPNARTDTLKGRSAETKYYFGAQVFAKGLWSFVTTVSSAEATTLPFDETKEVQNSIAIDTLYFDTQTNRIAVIWHRDTIVDSVEYGATFGLDSIATYASDPLTWELADTTGFDTTWLSPGKNLVFDSVYHVFLQLRLEGGKHSGVTRASSGKISTPGFTFQPVTYFTVTNRPDTVLVANGQIRLTHSGGWQSGELEDTLAVFEPTHDQLTGFVAAGPGFSFVLGREAQPLTLGIRYAATPSLAGKPGMYRYDNASGNWFALYEAVTDSAEQLIWYTTRDLGGGAFMLLIDTLPPSAVVVGDDTSVVEAGKKIDNRIRIRDNIANVKIDFRYAKGGEGWGDGIKTHTLSSPDSTVLLSIAAAAVTDDNGVRSYVTITDGVSERFLDLSRQVTLREGIVDVSVAPMSWMPLHAVAEHEDKSIRPVLTAMLGQDGEWEYNTKEIRLVRWLEHSGNNEKDLPAGWIQYSAANSHHFDLEPGRVFWIKTRDLLRLDYGSGVTLSLRDTFTIAIPGSVGGKQSWVDFAVPYKFNMRMGDIIAATGGTRVNRMQFYRWVPPTAKGEHFRTEMLYAGESSRESWKNLASEISGGTSDVDAYTVYNPNADTVFLKFPPIPRELSTVAAQGLSRSRAGSNGWWIDIRAGMFNTVTLGTHNGEKGSGEHVFYPSGPSFSSVSMHVLDRQTGGKYGHAFATRPQNGGYAFELALRNSASTQVSCPWSIDVSGLPSDLTALYWEPETDRSIELSGVAAVASHLGAQSTNGAYLLVGTQEYFEQFRAAAVSFKFKIVNAFPNPFKSAVAIRYTVPRSGVVRVSCSILDSKGRLVFRSESAQPGVGYNQFVWNGVGKDGHRAAAGVYLAKVRAFDAAGKSVRSAEQALVLLP